MTSDNPSGPTHHDPAGTPGITESAKREVRDARDRMSHAGEGARHEAGDIADRLKQRARDEAEGRKDNLAEGLHAFADTIRDAADDLGRRDQSLAARAVRETANGLERISRSLDEHSFADATRGLRSFGREHPVAFVAGGLVAGLALGRMLRASSHHHDDDFLVDELDHDDRRPGAGTMGSTRTTGGSTGVPAGPVPGSSPAARPSMTPGTTPGTSPGSPGSTSPGTTGASSPFSTPTTGGNDGRP
jgi:hypothetical protein